MALSLVAANPLAPMAGKLDRPVAGPAKPAHLRTRMSSLETPDGEVPIEPRLVDVGGVPIYYEAAGSGEAVVLVHGLSGSTRWWVKNVGALARRCRVHVIDLIRFGRGHRHSPFVLSEATGYLAKWLDHLGLERASFVGHSMGGYIAAELAADFPDKVGRLVLVDAAVLPLRSSSVRMALRLIRAVRRSPLSFLPVLIADAYRTGPVTLWRAARDIMAADISAKLFHIQAPTLVLWGEHDELIPVTVGEEMAATLPNAKMVVLEGAGHNPMWDRPAEFNGLVGDFLAGESGTGSQEGGQ